MRGSGQPCVSAASRALAAAIRALSRRFICPAPMPAVTPSFAYTIAFDLTCLATVQANRQSRISCSVGWRLVTQFSCSRVMMPLSRSWTRIPPAINAMLVPPRAGSGSAPVSSSRRFFLRAKIAFAPSSASGATTTSVKMSVMASAVATSSGWLVATIPPNAETLSHARASRHASTRLSRVATPQGLACLTMTTVGGASRNSAASSRAALASLRLL